MKKSYVSLDIYLTWCVQVEDARLMWMPEQDVGWLSIWSVVTCRMEGDFLYS